MFGLITGLMGGLGSLISAGSSAAAADDAAFEAELNRQWQMYAQHKQWEREDNAVQRRAKDLALAGINPLLAGQNGATSTLSVTNLDNPALYRMQGAQAIQQGFTDGANLMNAIHNTEIADKKTIAEIKHINQNIENLKTQNSKTLAETANTIQNTDNLKIEKELIKENIKVNRETINKIKAETATYVKGLAKLRAEIDNIIISTQGQTKNIELTEESIKKIIEETQSEPERRKLVEVERKLQELDLKTYNNIDDIMGTGGSGSTNVITNTITTILKLILRR